MDNNKEFKVEEVLDLRWHQNKLEYLVHWHRYDISKCT
uniref:Chromo domain-containing protein n=1 Tax=Physcomitrium patens TaxID=3218 RepID=Q948W3_PHYPA|nr:unnamed protein product [Physcomitrium patens]